MSQSSKFLLLDLDDTLFTGQSQALLINYLFKLKKISFFTFFYLWWLFLQYKLGLRSTVDLMALAYKKVVIFNVDEFKEIIRGFYDTVMLSRLRPEILSLVAGYKLSGSTVILLSNTIQPIVDIITQRLDVDQGYGTQLEVMYNCYTGNLVGYPLYGAGKVRFLKEKLNFSRQDFLDSTFVSDSFSDLPLLKEVGNPMVVTPDRKLLNYANFKSWRIIKLA